MQFKQVIGQLPIKQRLIQSVQQGNISHAQLLVGPAGCGKLALAQAYTQYINCLQPTPTDSCAKCSACLKSQKRIHPDIHYSYPTIGNKAISTHFIKEWRTAMHKNPYLSVFEWLQYLKAENKQGNINTLECDAIIKKLSLTAFEAKQKVLIMWLPEYLGKEGINYLN